MANPRAGGGEGTPLITEESRRGAIAHYYADVLQMEDPESWDGPDGTISTILRELSLGSRSMIRRVLDDVWGRSLRGEQYDPSKKTNSGGQNKLILPGSVEEEILALAIESNQGFTSATHQVNEYRRTLVPSPGDVGRSAVRSAHLRLKPVITPVLDSKQGSFDESSAWAVARLMFVLQLLVRFGLMSGVAAWFYVDPTGAAAAAAASASGAVAGMAAAGTPTLPAYFNISLIGTLSIHQIAFWDETHKKQVIGGHGHDGHSSRTQTRYRRGPTGKLDPNGELADRLTQLKVKYVKESRFCFGVAWVKYLLGEEGGVGVRAKPLDYSEKWVVTRREYDLHMDEEIARVKTKVKGDGAPWVTGKRGADELFTLDPVTCIKGVGITMARKLATGQIFTVGDLNESTMVSVGGVELSRFRGIAARATEGAFPADRVVDHKLAENPYLSRYGEGWRDVIAEVSGMKGYLCIETLIRHIVVESAALFKGTEHEDDWRFYHDALSQLTAGATVEWMKTEMWGELSFFDRWIKPEQGLSSGTIFAGRPPGNSPELMPLDASLNKDVDDCVGRQVAACACLKPGMEGYAERFSRATPKLQTEAYLRVFDPSLGPDAGAPLGSRICQDVGKFLVALSAIRDARGTCVPGLCSRSGPRAAASTGLGQHGGHRVKRAHVEHWYHDDVLPARKRQLVISLARHAGAAVEAIELQGN